MPGAGRPHCRKRAALLDALGWRLLLRSNPEVSPSSGGRGLAGGRSLRGRAMAASGLWALRKAPLLVLGGRAALRRLGSGPGAHWGPPRRGWRLGAGLGLAVAAVAAAAAGGDEEKPAAGFARAVGSSRELLRRVKDEVGAPGVVVGVAVDGKEVWSEGLGYADVENQVLCKPETVLRIASISKPLTMVAAAKLWEEGKLDLDAPVQKYVPEFPEKEYEGTKVAVTTRLLASHLSGIRHYEKDAAKVKEEKEKFNRALKAEKGAIDFDPEERDSEGSAKSKPEREGKNSKGGRRKREFENEEYYLKEKYDNVIESLSIFKNDPLFFKPGSQYLYSTHGFTLLSAIVERASGHKFTEYMLKIFHDLGMSSTVLDENEPLIYNRARYYTHNKKGQLVNTPYVDNSYKWAGGGFLSTVGDLLKFGNAMLYGYQLRQRETLPAGLLPGYLKPGTIEMLWTAVPKTETSWSQDDKYGMAWQVVEKKQAYGFCRQPRHYTYHCGGAVGASSVLLILPEEWDSREATGGGTPMPPKGVVVTVICNMQSVSLSKTALKIAMEFEKDKSGQHAGKNGSFCD
ncbi:serine beta-lactamase-like protein LACTB, mitochondrial [Heteronotia binoei]|uniref:serine beta-lactamase-like protein LACTB, mitochondrial n=1 Tax=Heteronotia binoei TaxID=13085 RepID=UPI0029305188|nr:serine beta-lactamase-like protein LACTB, mitochondrial [Heteronotia binoei]